MGRTNPFRNTSLSFEDRVKVTMVPIIKNLLFSGSVALYQSCIFSIVKKQMQEKLYIQRDTVYERAPWHGYGIVNATCT